VMDGVVSHTQKLRMTTRDEMMDERRQAIFAKLGLTSFSVMPKPGR